jgi:hypothetical protein
MLQCGPIVAADRPQMGAAAILNTPMVRMDCAAAAYCSTTGLKI